MKWFTRLPIVRDLYARGLLFPAVLGLAVLGVLLHGTLSHQAPAEALAEGELPRTPVEVPGFRPDLEKSPLTYRSDYYRQLGESIQNKFVLLGGERIPGVVVAPGVALTTLRAADGLAAEQQGTGEQEGRASREILGVDTARGLALIAVKQDDPEASFNSRGYWVLPPGAAIAAVSLGPDARVRVTPGSAVSLSTATEGFLDVAVPFSDLLEAAALVDLDGNLIGVAMRTNEAIEVMSLEEVNMIVERLAAGPVCQAVEVGDLTAELRSALGVPGGVAVERVRQDSFLPEPSIHEGDVLLSWNGEPVESAEEFVGLYQSTEAGELVRYVAWRGRQRVSGRTRMPMADCRAMEGAGEVLAAWGVTLKWARETGWRVIQVVDDSPAARGGLMDGDLTIAADGDALSESDRRRLVRLEQSTRAVVLTLRRGDRVKLLAVNPGAG